MQYRLNLKEKKRKLNVGSLNYFSGKETKHEASSEESIQVSDEGEKEKVTAPQTLQNNATGYISHFIF